MQQPDLGRRIAKLRRAKELTQEELANQCGINVRTLQRIESGSVLPRSYTIRLLSDVLDAPLNGATENTFAKNAGRRFRNLFNLKKHTMAKVSVLGVIALIAGFFLVSGLHESRAQSSSPFVWVENNSQGIIFLFPREQNGRMHGGGNSSKGDIITYHTTPYRIEQHKTDGSIFLGEKFVSKAEPGDTVIYHPQSLSNEPYLEIRRYRAVIVPSFGNSGIVFKFPPLPLSGGSVDGGGQIYRLGERIVLKEVGNNIYLNNAYQGQAFRGDTVELQANRLLVIHKRKND